MVEYEYAFDINKEVVCIDDISKSSKDQFYYCPECDGKMIARLGKVRSPHFAHYNSTEHSGTGESILHYNTKLCVYQYFKNNIFNEVTTELSFKINQQSYYSRYSPLQNIDSVQLEYHDDSGFIPDIGLLSNGKLHTAVEIVYQHQDTEDKINYYKENNINVLYIYLKNIHSYTTVKKQLKNENLFFKLPRSILHYIANDEGDNLSIKKIASDLYNEYLDLTKSARQISDQVNDFIDDGHYLIEEIVTHDCDIRLFLSKRFALYGFYRRMFDEVDYLSIRNYHLLVKNRNVFFYLDYLSLRSAKLNMIDNQELEHIIWNLEHTFIAFNRVCGLVCPNESRISEQKHLQNNTVKRCPICGKIKPNHLIYVVKWGYGYTGYACHDCNKKH